MSLQQPNAVLRIRLVLVDDHPLVRDGLRARLSSVPRLDVVGEAGSGREALELADTLRPDIMLVDIGMRDMNGIQLTAALRERHPGVVVVILSMYDNAEYVSSAVRAGARGYVLKDAPSQEIIAAIEAAVAGGSYYSHAVTHALIEPAPQPDPLTEREREVLLLLAAGHSNKMVAASLEISVRTVEAHRLNLRRKLGAENVAALVKYAMERGWIKG
ncbi:two component transcriptional regulator, LuxR family [Pseudogulbenkiania sp. NH8B]|uniref:response regulator n=1 Tax=Pseudogulbenkiania sp. (strain NH8B) TaxID=748280 RepID=UPI0002279AA5|nr:response regulator transcription factor [Pseudogulbenkiania sp. NH8B]BAK76346.1 two component transcriptional regulator, LuxR family [Pseudogulbenkiania sp. NH8B]